MDLIQFHKIGRRLKNDLHKLQRLHKTSYKIKSFEYQYNKSGKLVKT